MNLDELVASVLAKLDVYEGDDELSDLAEEYEETTDSPVDILVWVRAVLERMEALKVPDADVDELASRLEAL